MALEDGEMKNDVQRPGKGTKEKEKVDDEIDGYWTEKEKKSFGKFF